MSTALNIGISVFNTANANIWSSGINQNIGFLAQLLAKTPGVGRVFLLNGGDAEVLSPMLGMDGLELVRPSEVTHEIDVVIEMGAKLPVEWMRRVAALGTKIVWFLVGHTYATILEGSIFGHSGATPFNGAPVDEVWYLPQHERTCAPMLETVLRVPTYCMPHIWSPVFLNPEIHRQEQALGKKFGFLPKPDGWNVAIFEPNISVVKSGFIPMLVCEQAFRLDPAAITTMRVMNSFHMKEHMTFNRFASNLDINAAGRASYEPRLSFAEAMLSQNIDAVVAHQWECDLNYAYYDALYGGYPLFHNSERLKRDGVGFYYEGFSAVEGAHKLIEAWRQPPDFWLAYQKHAQQFLARLAPDAQANIQAFAKRLNLTVGDQA